MTASVPTATREIADVVPSPRTTSRTGAGWARRNALALGIGGVTAIVYSAFSVHLHATFQSNSYDLGIFGQGLKGYADGTGPVSPIKGVGYSLLGDHFSPILAVLAPIYSVFRTIEVLLVAQAVLLGAGAVPLVALAQRRLGVWQAAAVGLVYATSFGLASAVAYDFHEIAFAVPLLSFSLCALIERRWAATVAWAAPLVLVKEDLGLTVAAIGLVLVIRRRRGLGGAVALFGVGATLVETFVLIPLMNAKGGYDYSNQMTGSALDAVLHPTLDVLMIKASTVVLTLAVGCFVGTRSTIVLVIVPTLVWRFAGSNPGYWGTSNQYSAILMPIVVAAALEVLIRRQVAGPSGRRFVRWALVASAAMGIGFFASYPLRAVVHPGFWSVSTRSQELQEAVDRVPAGTTVAASNKIVPHLTDRATVTVFTDSTATVSGPEWIVADLTEVTPDTPEARTANVKAALSSGYHEVSAADGIVVLRR